MKFEMEMKNQLCEYGNQIFFLYLSFIPSLHVQKKKWFFGPAFTCLCKPGITLFIFIRKILYSILKEHEAHFCSKFKNNPSLGRRVKISNFQFRKIIAVL